MLSEHLRHLWIMPSVVSLVPAVCLSLYCVHSPRIYKYSSDERNSIHCQTKGVGSSLAALAIRDAEVDLGADACRHSAPHGRVQERQADLVCGLQNVSIEPTGQIDATVRTVHPPEAFARYHLEVDALVAVLRSDEVRELDSVELCKVLTLAMGCEERRHAFSGTTPLKSTNAVVIMYKKR